MADPLPLGISLVVILLLVAMNGFFIAAELALVNVRGSRIDSGGGVDLSLSMLTTRSSSKVNGYISVCRLGITMVTLALGWIGGLAIATGIKPLFVELGLANMIFARIVAYVLAFICMTTLHIVLGQFIPRLVAIHQSETVLRLTSKPLLLFYKLIIPFMWLFNKMEARLLRIIGIDPFTEKDLAHTEDEIRILMKESHKSGLIDKTELTLVDNIFDFTETNAREIMIPRTDMICLNTNSSLESNKRIALEQMLTRYPVCEDDKDNIIGFVHIKDLLKDTAHALHDIRQITRPITTVPESMQISMLLKLMQKRRSQIAILIDEYGGTSGLVTLEDIMEEIVGDIQDEFDEEREPMERMDEYSYSVNGLILIEEVNSFFGLDIETDNYDTFGGWLYSRVNLPPVSNQRVAYSSQYEFIIEEIDHMRITRIIVRRLGDKDNIGSVLGVL